MNTIESLIENTTAQMRKGLLEYCIFVILSQKARYSSDILTILKDADLLVVEGTLYPLLSRLKKSGLLDYKWEESPSGPPRKYYELTKEGLKLKKELEKSWESLSSSINKIIKMYE